MTSNDLTPDQKAQLADITKRVMAQGFERAVVRVVNDPQRLKDGKNGFYLELEAYRDKTRYEATAAFDGPGDVGSAIASLAVAVEG